MTEQLFVCKLCGEDKTAKEMRADSRAKSGVLSECKKCRNNREFENGSVLKNRVRKYKYRKGDNSVINIDVFEGMLNSTNCAYCNVEMTRGDMTATSVQADHVYPLEAKAFDGYGSSNVLQNMVVVCKGCNSSKGTDHVHDFYERSEKFTPELYTAFVRNFGSYLFKHELTDIEVEQLKRGFAEEAAELRANLAPKEGAIG